MSGVVCKFGGSSLSEAAQIRKVVSIIRSDNRRRFIVVSAPGKRKDDDEKITDLLYKCQHLAAEGKSFSEHFSAVRNRYLEIERELNTESGMEQMLGEVENQLGSGASPDLAASRGEYLCARLLSVYLGATFVDAAEAVKINADGSVDEASYPAVAQRVGQPGIYVVPGFYGSGPNGDIRTFSRGGSDITGAIVARAVEAHLYENWTDVSGLLMVDPRLVREPKVIETVTYREIRELSWMGARVFHEEAMVPIYKQNIPINIRNTNRPEDAGTMIVAERDPGYQTITGVAGRKGRALIYLEKFLLDRNPTLPRRFVEILEQSNIDCRRLRIGIDSVAIVVAEQQLEGKVEILRRQIHEELCPDKLEIKRDLAEIVVIGEGLSDRIDVVKQIFCSLADAGINVLLTDQGTSKISVVLVVEAGDFERAIQTLYGHFS